jgi:large subunit ribosomal protein L7Ae
VIFKQGVCLTVVSFPLLQIVHSRTATALCLTSVKNEDKHDFSKIVEAVKVH